MTTPATAAIGHSIVLYDGLCGMCDGVVQFLLRHDRKDAFRFAPQQGEEAKQILARHALNPAAMETLFFIEHYDRARERVYTRSEAVLRMAKDLGGIWTLALATRLLPRILRDACYDLIAGNRYRIFGRRTECRVPSSQDQHKFLV
jgi:predicted DCC family thiol-disulfide oxidoreductase YuxK